MAKDVMSDLLKKYSISQLSTMTNLSTMTLERFIDGGSHCDSTSYDTLKQRLMEVKELNLTNEFFAPDYVRPVEDTPFETKKTEPVANAETPTPKKRKRKAKPMDTETNVTNITQIPQDEETSATNSVCEKSTTDNTLSEITKKSTDNISYEAMSSSISSEICSLVKERIGDLKEKHKNTPPKKPFYQTKEANELAELLPRLSADDTKMLLSMAKRML